jgi:hypothetical protein
MSRYNTDSVFIETVQKKYELSYDQAVGLFYDTRDYWHENSEKAMNNETPQTPPKGDNDTLNMYFSPTAPVWLKALVTGAIEQARDSLGEPHPRRADEGFRAHILEHGSYEEKQSLFAFEAGDEAVQENKVKAKLRKKLLAEAGKKEPILFYQIDGYVNVPPGDCIMNPDGDGDVLTGDSTWELRRNENEVRVLIHEGTKPEDVLRLLKKIRKWLKRDKSLLLNIKPTYYGIEEDDDSDIPF